MGSLPPLPPSLPRRAPEQTRKLNNVKQTAPFTPSGFLARGLRSNNDVREGTLCRAAAGQSTRVRTAQGTSSTCHLLALGALLQHSCAASDGEESGNGCACVADPYITGVASKVLVANSVLTAG